MNIVVFALGFSILFISSGCKKEIPVIPPDQPKKEIQLTLQDTSCTEVWLKLAFTNFSAPHNFKIYRNSSIAFSGTLFSNDTTLIDTALLPQHSYNYKVIRTENNIVTDSSKIFVIKTMDTTSHDFIWTLETIGYQSSVVRDVAIVNDTLVYAVGKFYEKDTNTNTQTPYNIARWNGKKWDLIRVSIEIPVDPPFPPGYAFNELYSIQCFSNDEIWLADGGYVITRWDGKSTKGKQYLYAPSSVQSLWGTSTNNIYGAGHEGSFVHYNGSLWIKQDSLTSTTLNDIYGTYDGKEVWVAGWESNGKCAVLRYKDGLLKKVYEWSSPKPDDFLKEFIRSLWINKQKVYLPSSSTYIYTYSLRTNAPSKEKFQLQYFPYSLRGSSENNIVIACEFGMIYHFNGSTWKLFDQLSFQDQSPYGGVDVSKNLIVVGGTRFYGIHYSGFIIFGKKY